MTVNTPLMGWNSWNTFGANINEQMIFETADTMVREGLLDCGYEYLVIDDCWQSKTRDANGRLVPDPEKFPHGMKYVSDYVHSKGLKFGMYSCIGAITCAEYPGSYNHEFTDAKSFAEWGIDFLKYDFCFRDENIPAKILYRRMGLALANCGRDIKFSVSSFGKEETQDWIRTTGASMWRFCGDIFDTWGSIKKITGRALDRLGQNYKGCFMDMDMLVVGMNGKGNVATEESALGFEEYKFHFSLWSLLGSPLMIGCDIRNMSEETKAILTNKEVIAICQDPACNQIIFHKHEPHEQFIASRILANGDIAIGFFNLGDTESDQWGSWLIPEELGWTRESGTRLLMRDLWDGTEKYLENDIFMEKGIPPHSCRLFRVSLVSQ